MFKKIFDIHFEKMILNSLVEISFCDIGVMELKWIGAFRKFLCICFCAVCFTSLAQVPSNDIGSNPHRLKWRQINNDLVQVVFPEGQEADAKRVADLISYLSEQDNEDIGQLQQKVSIFLHGHRAIANGLVTVGPFRSELFQTSPQMANSTDYLDLLAIHEYRHTQQFANATQGITKTVKHVLGSWAWGGMMATALPRWYFEGDAVFAETEYSASGRGRRPNFLMQYNALIQADKNYNYEKAGAGSYKDYVPDWYPLGYHMLRYGREKYGEDIWQNVVTDAVRYKGLFTPFSRSLKKRTGLSTTDLYNSTMKDLIAKWENKNIKSKKYESIILGYEKVVSNYSNPIMVRDNEIVYSKASFDQWGAFYLLDQSGHSKKLTEYGILTEGVFNFMSANNNAIYWAELGFDARWANQNWSNIYKYDLNDGTKKRLTNKTRFFSPDINNAGSQLAVVEIDQNQTTHIATLDANTGDKTHQIPNSEQYHIQHPRWLDDNDLLAIFSKDELTGIGKVNKSKGEIEWLTPLTSRQLSHPMVAADLIFYSGGYSDVNQIYVLDPSSKEIRQATFSIIGAFQPFYDSESQILYFSEFSADGMKLKSTAINYKDLPVVELKSALKANRFLPSHTSELPNIPEENYDIKKYSKLTGILNPHSLLADIDDSSAELILRSDNKFSTMSAEARARYNYNEDRWSYGVGFNYAEFFPILNASVSKSFRSALFTNFNSPNDTTILSTTYIGEWSENSISGGFRIPINFSRGNMSNSLRLGGRFIRTSMDVSSGINGDNFRIDTTIVQSGAVPRNEYLFDVSLQEESFSTVDLNFSIQMVKRRALQHLIPRMGWAAFGRYRNRLSQAKFDSDVWVYGGAIYLPGIGRNHGIQLEFIFQHENFLSNYRFGDAFNYPRGYNSSQRADNFGKIGLNYSFPIFYPDMALGGLAFLKRLKGTFFYDHGWLGIDSFQGNNIVNNMRSVGFEFGIDFRALRLVEVDLGLRYSYLLNPDFSAGKRHQFDFFVISISE